MYRSGLGDIIPLIGHIEDMMEAGERSVERQRIEREAIERYQWEETKAANELYCKGDNDSDEFVVRVAPMRNCFGNLSFYYKSSSSSWCGDCGGSMCQYFLRLFPNYEGASNCLLYISKTQKEGYEPYTFFETEGNPMVRSSDYTFTRGEYGFVKHGSYADVTRENMGWGWDGIASNMNDDFVCKMLKLKANQSRVVWLKLKNIRQVIE